MEKSHGIYCFILQLGAWDDDFKQLNLYIFVTLSNNLYYGVEIILLAQKSQSVI